MKARGIVRKLNDNGRVVIPMEWRRDYGIEDDDAQVELFAQEKGIFIRKYEPSCIFCGEIENLIMIEDKKICKKCIEKLNK